MTRREPGSVVRTRGSRRCKREVEGEPKGRGRGRSRVSENE